MATSSGVAQAAAVSQTALPNADLIPESLRDQIPSALTAFANVSQAGIARNEVKSVLNIAKNLKPGVCVNPNVATRYLENSSNHTLIVENREPILQVITSNDGANEHVKSVVKDSLGQAVNGVLISTAISGGVQLLLTFTALWKLYKDIEKLELVVQENGPELEAIKTELEAIPPKLEEFTDIVQQMERMTSASAEVKRLNGIQKRKARGIENILTNVEGRLEIMLERYQDIRQELEKSRSGAMTAGVSGIVTGGSNIITTAILNSAGHPALLCTNGVIGVLNVIFGEWPSAC